MTRSHGRSRSSIPEPLTTPTRSVGYKRRMRNARRFQLDELILRPGTYFNPQTEIMLVVDDSPEVDHELFEVDDLDAADWIQISEDAPLDEHRRDDLVERFQLAHQPGAELSDGDDVDEVDDDKDDEDDEDDAEGDHAPGGDGLGFDDPED
jgi:hypothetical protein